MLATTRALITPARRAIPGFLPMGVASNSHCTGTSAGAPLFLIKNTRNFAGLVLLAFRDERKKDAARKQRPRSPNQPTDIELIVEDAGAARDPMPRR